MSDIDPTRDEHESDAVTPEMDLDDAAATPAEPAGELLDEDDDDDDDMDDVDEDA